MLLWNPCKVEAAARPFCEYTFTFFYMLLKEPAFCFKEERVGVFGFRGMDNGLVCLREAFVYC